MKAVLVITLVFVGISSTISGMILMNNPGGEVLNLSPGLLTETPFTDFLIPGILLAIIVGAVNLLAVVFNMLKIPGRYNWAMAGGIMISGWIIAQMILIQVVHWLHFLYLGTGILIILLALQLKGRWAA